jgi:hypothetical protein
MNLYQLTKNYLEIINLSDELDEEVLADTIASIEEPLEIKMANIVKVIRSIEADNDFIETEEKRLKALRESKKNTIKRLKNMLLDSVEIVGKETKSGGKKLEVKGDAFVKSVYTQKNPPSVEIIDPKLIPDDFKIPQDPKIDSKAIIEAWKNNLQVEGANVTQGVGVRFK